MRDGRAAADATERTPLTLGPAATATNNNNKRDNDDTASANASVLYGSIVGLAGICLLMLILIGGASHEVYQIVVQSSSPSHQLQHIVVVEAEAGDDNVKYRTGCRYYKTTHTKTKQEQPSSSILPPRILQTSMGQAGSPWSWLDCEDATAASQTIELNAARAPDAVIKVDFGSGKTAAASANTSPTIMGFGGAFTEASALNFQRLSSTGQTTVLDLLFGKNGLGYSLGRIPIHSCDFAVQSYDFDSVVDDVELRYFDDQVSHDINNGMIPFIQAAQATYQAGWGNSNANSSFSTTSSFKLFGSPWSPPAWMKRPTTNNDPPGSLYASGMTHSAEPSCLRGELGADGSVYAAAWAHYIAKWIQAYGRHGIPIHAVTVQNEPEFPAPWEACSYSATNMTDFVAYHLGPRLAAMAMVSSHAAAMDDNTNNTATTTTTTNPPTNPPTTQIWAFDHNKDHVNTWMQTMLNGTGSSSSSPLAREYVKGTGYHWYAGGMDRLLDGALGIANLHRLRADLKALHNVSGGADDEHIVLGTEACHCPSTGYAGGDITVYWSRAERYAHAILADLAAGSQGWVEWNLILDSIGGPNHLGNLCDASLLSVPHRAANATDDIAPLPDFEYHPPANGRVTGDNRTREELNALGFPAQFLDHGVAVQPLYHYMGHISRYVRPGSRSLPALIHSSLGAGDIFRTHGAAVAGGGENDLARDGIELLTWPCEGSTRQQFRWNAKTGTISVAGHSWLGDPTVACVGAKNDVDLRGVRLVDCTQTTRFAGQYDPLSIAGDPHERVTIRLRNSSIGRRQPQCLTLLELANGGGSYGPLGGAQVALGPCSAESAKWVVDATMGTVKSLYFRTNNSNASGGPDHGKQQPPPPSEVALSRTVCMTTGWPFLQMGAFVTPNGTAPHTIVILNEAKDPANYAVTGGGGVVLTGSIPSRSIQTILLDQR